MKSKNTRCCSTRGHRHFHRHTAFYVPKPLHTLTALLLLLLIFLSALPATAAEPTFSFSVLEIPDIQRGAGLVIVMRSPSGKTWLYDTGTAHPEKNSLLRRLARQLQCRARSHRPTVSKSALLVAALVNRHTLQPANRPQFLQQN